MDIKEYVEDTRTSTAAMGALAGLAPAGWIVHSISDAGKDDNDGGLWKRMHLTRTVEGRVERLTVDLKLVAEMVPTNGMGFPDRATS